LPATGGRIGPEPEDFLVDEVPLYAASGEGAHLYVRVRKRGMTTPQLLRALSRASGVKDRDIGYAGLKDKHAVTSQWFSFPNLDASVTETWQLPPDVSVLECTRHNNKLRTGHQAGNRFTLRLVDVERPDPALFDTYGQRLCGLGLPNTFDEQRFGNAGSGLADALRWLRHGGRVDRFLFKLYPSVVQSEVFNRYVALRCERGLERPLVGEVVRLDGSSKHFVVEEPDREAPRLAEFDIHLTGPMVGPKCLASHTEALELEEQALREAGVDEEVRAKLYAQVPGTRRDLFVRARDYSFQINGTDVTVSFALPSGSYATLVVKQLTTPRPSAA
jgi:tRNA pseudouridine13 synthase